MQFYAFEKKETDRKFSQSHFRNEWRSRLLCRIANDNFHCNFLSAAFSMAFIAFTYLSNLDLVTHTGWKWQLKRKQRNKGERAQKIKAKLRVKAWVSMTALKIIIPKQRWGKKEANDRKKAPNPYLRHFGNGIVILRVLFFVCWRNANVPICWLFRHGWLPVIHNYQ